MKFLKTIIVVFLVAGMLSIAQHHHDDFDEHDDCPVCALVQNGLDFDGDIPGVVVFLVVICELVSEIRVFKTSRRFHFYKPRGPPCFSA